MTTIVTTAAGAVAGHAADGVTAFQGIPYAAPPVGRLRFAPPEPSVPWTGTRDATTPGPAAPQPVSRLEHVMGPMRLPQSEDCLSVNVWTPDTRGRRPVLVWLHGGGFSSGSGGAAWYSGAALAAAGDLVVVTPNYRLGALGFLCLEELADDLGRGNFGLLDTVAALEWVRENIAGFGGDPGRVTLAGQSAGALSTLALLSSPRAAGLFGQVALQSTPAAARPARPGEAAETAERYLRALNLSPAQAHRLREEPLDRLLGAQTSVARDLARPLALTPPFQLVADPGLVAADLVGAAENVPDAPRLVGTTRDEVMAWPVRDDVDDVAALEIAAGFGDGPARDAYVQARQASPAVSPARTLAGVAGDHYFHRALPRLGSGHYVYRFDWHPDGSELGACHCIDLPFVLGSPSAWCDAPMLGGALPPELSVAMRAAWGAFVRDGAPGVPGWRRYHRPGDAMRVDSNADGTAALTPLGALDR